MVPTERQVPLATGVIVLGMLGLIVLVAYLFKGHVHY